MVVRRRSCRRTRRIWRARATVGAVRAECVVRILRARTSVITDVVHRVVARVIAERCGLQPACLRAQPHCARLCGRVPIVQ
eukprot:4738044-Prymnesium_polylepis.1